MRVLHVHVQCLCVFYCFGFSYFVMLYLMILGKRGQGISDWIQLLPSNNTGDDAEQKLLVGAVIAEEMRAAVYKETGFRCSAGIAHNKVYTRNTGARTKVMGRKISKRASLFP